jgi:hypothetical protein
MNLLGIGRDAKGEGINRGKKSEQKERQEAMN